MNGDPVDNYRQIVVDFIQKHSRGLQKVGNVSGQLFYLIGVRSGSDWTCEDLLSAMRKCCPRNVKDIETLLQ